MRKFLVIFILVVSPYFAIVSTLHPNHAKFQEFKKKHDKITISAEEEKRKLEIYSQNIDKIEASKQEYKNGKASFFLQETFFTDMVIFIKFPIHIFYQICDLIL